MPGFIYTCQRAQRADQSNEVMHVSLSPMWWGHPVLYWSVCVGPVTRTGTGRWLCESGRPAWWIGPRPGFTNSCVSHSFSPSCCFFYRSERLTGHGGLLSTVPLKSIFSLQSLVFFVKKNDSPVTQVITKIYFSTVCLFRCKLRTDNINFLHCLFFCSLEITKKKIASIH